VSTVAIIGSRDYPDLEAVRAYVRSLPADAVIVSGGARGVDSVAEDEARKRGLQTIIYPPDYAKHGQHAPLVRDAEIVAACERLVAFWDGRSSGTSYKLGLARDAGKAVKLFQSHSTAGQARILEFAARGHRRLVAYKPAPDTWVYEIIELSVQSGEAPRLVMTVTPVMVKSLVDQGWIERAGRINYRDGWVYRVTESGLENRWY
jgi:hypothetical protein